jgi:hypothetical protein
VIQQKRTKWIGCAFLVLTAVFGSAAFWLNYSAHVLAVPVRLTPGFQSQVAFRVVRKADYRISVFCSSSADKEYLRKLLLGGNLVSIAVTRNGDALPLYLLPEPLFRLASSQQQSGAISFSCPTVLGRKSPTLLAGLVVGIR